MKLSGLRFAHIINLPSHAWYKLFYSKDINTCFYKASYWIYDAVPERCVTYFNI